MNTIHVSVSNGYNIYIGSGLLGTIGERAAEVVSGRTAVIITDDIVQDLYGDLAKRSLECADFVVHTFVFPHGEGSKNLTTLSEVLEFLARNKFTRFDLIVALGGGVVGDLAGFAAAVYLRGVRYIQVPTTLLAAVDSSVGGKTAVDLASGKNLAGAFWQPSAVICDTDTLDTLPGEILADGVAEALKYGILFDPELFHLIKDRENFREKREEIISCCLRWKRDIVERDERDTGDRQLLNLGHTIGHAIEKLSGFSVSHGRAVAAGMAMIARGAHLSGISDENCVPAIAEALAAWGLPSRCDYTAGQILDAALSDKKRQGNNITLVLPKRVGKCEMVEFDVKNLINFFTLCVENSDNSVTIKPGKLCGTVDAPPSKSIAHRSLICAALSDRPTEVVLKSMSQDIEATMRCLEALGAIFTKCGDTVSIVPIVREKIPRNPLLDCGESGSTLRFMLPVVAALGCGGIFSGSGRLPDRPLSALREELTRHGVEITPDGVWPIKLSGRLHGGKFMLPGNVSSQFFTGPMLAAPIINEDVTIMASSTLESKSYIDITIEILNYFGVSGCALKAVNDLEGWSIPAGQAYKSSGVIHVEGDWSNASFWLVGGIIGSGITCRRLKTDSAQGDRAIVGILREMGAGIEVDQCNIISHPSTLHGITIDASDIPDLVPILAVAATQAAGTTTIINAGRLRMKESDRLTAITNQLRAVGGQVEELSDGLRIIGGKLRGGTVSSENDHRIAMAMAIAASVCEQPVTILGAEAVKKSYPDFFDQFDKLRQN